MRLLPGEKPLSVYRQTKAVLFGSFVLSALIAYIPIRFLNQYDLIKSLGRIPAVWLILVALYFLNELVLWFKNKTLLTNQRMLVITYHHILHKQVTDLPKDKIVNISFLKKGIFPNLLDFGNVIIQQQSLSEPIVLKNLPDPGLVKDQIVMVIKS